MRFLIPLLAVVFLNACGTISGAVERGFDFSKERVDNYCADTPQMERELLRDRVAYDDGSPRVVVFCQPGGTFTE